MSFATTLRSLRKERGMTQEAVALACGWQGQSRIGNYESGKRTPGMEELKLLARALDVNIEALFGDPAIESQSVRLNVEIVRDVAQALKNVFASELHQTYSLIDQPELFVELYERVVAQEAGTHSQANVVWLGRMIERVALQGAQHDGERASPKHREHAAGHTQRRKAKG